MRAREFIKKARRKPPVSLRHLNKQKEVTRQRKASEAKRRSVVQMMYASTSWQREQLELERQQLELEQLRAAMAAGPVDPKDIRLSRPTPQRRRKS